MQLKLTPVPWKNKLLSIAWHTQSKTRTPNPQLQTFFLRPKHLNYTLYTLENPNLHTNIITTHSNILGNDGTTVYVPSNTLGQTGTPYWYRLTPLRRQDCRTWSIEHDLAFKGASDTWHWTSQSDENSRRFVSVSEACEASSRGLQSHLPRMKQ